MSSAAPLHLSAAQRHVADVLTEVHDATILEIAAAAAVSKSTAAKTLTMLEEAGAAARAIHADGEIRLADTWSPTPLTRQLLMGAGAGEQPSDGLLSAAQPTMPDGDDGPGEAGLDDGAASEVTNEERQPDEPDGEPTQIESAHVSGMTPATGPTRLGSGELAQLVADRLAENPLTEYTPTMLSHLLGGRSSGAISNLCGSSEDEAPRPRRVKGELRASVAVVLAARPDLELSPTEIANVLGASAGAVANALDRLVSDGSAVLTCERPRRFRASGS